MIYSAICIKFDVKGMTHGYKNIAPEHFDNIIQLIARLPIHDEKAMLFFTQDELDNLIAERVKAIEGEFLPKEERTHSEILMLEKLELSFKFEGQDVRVSSISDHALIDTKNQDHIDLLVTKYTPKEHLPKLLAKISERLDTRFCTREAMILELKNDGYIVAKKDELNIGNMVLEHIPARLLPIMIEVAGQRLRGIEAGKSQA